MKQFGLIGKTLKHSFSKKYFSEKFNRENISDCQYDLFELADLSDFPKLLANHKSLLGLNVTIPYKKDVIAFLDELDEVAAAIQAVNTIKITDSGKCIGFNTDYTGFKNSLLKGWNLQGKKALILGTGGAAQAVKKALLDLDIPFASVSRTAHESNISYENLMEQEHWLKTHELIINTTPLGTFPNIDEKPDLPYALLSPKHLLFDLVYNPEVTAFLQEGLKAKASTKNGYDMLVGQAEAAWKIWSKN